MRPRDSSLLQQRFCGQKIALAANTKDDVLSSSAVNMKTRVHRRRFDAERKTGGIKAQTAGLGLWFLRFGATLAVLGALGWGARESYKWALASDRFAISAITFRGLDEAKEADLLRLSGLAMGQNILALDGPAVESSLAAHPWVKRAELNRVFPHRLEVHVIEHVPVALVSMGELYLVDEDGTPFKRVKPGDSADFPMVTGIGRDDFIASSEDAKRRLKEALSKLTIYCASETGQLDPVSEIHVEADGFSLMTTSSQWVQFGDGSFAEKLKRLSRVRSELQARKQFASRIRLDNRVRPSWVTVQHRNFPAQAGAKEVPNLALPVQPSEAGRRSQDSDTSKALKSVIKANQINAKKVVKLGGPEKSQQ
jgi:cell division protein FtsQ